MGKKRKQRATRRTKPAKSGAASQRAVDGSRDRAGFNPDYSYVIKDLRRIALLAGSLIGLLIVLSFFLS